MSKPNPMLAMALMTAAMLGGGVRSPHFGHELTDEEKKFLETLDPVGRQIWGRCMARGLTDSERAFIREQMEEKQEGVL